jgi:hypothetical protein
MCVCGVCVWLELERRERGFERIWGFGLSNLALAGCAPLPCCPLARQTLLVECGYWVLALGTASRI